MIGAASLIVLGSFRSVAGISGIASSLLQAERRRAWKLSFVLGLLATGTVLALWAPATMAVASGRTLPQLAVAGLLVGFGTALGNGCTSGHGICGIARGSRRSIVATCVFMGTAMVTVALMRILGSGGVG